MSGHTNWRKLRDELRAKPGADEAIARARQESLEELRLYELRHAEAVSQAELAGRLEVTQGRSRSSSTPTMSGSRHCANISKLSVPALS